MPGLWTAVVRRGEGMSNPHLPLTSNDMYAQQYMAINSSQLRSHWKNTTRWIENMVVKEGGEHKLKLREKLVNSYLRTVHAKTFPPRTEADSSFVPHWQNSKRVELLHLYSVYEDWHYTETIYIKLELLPPKKALRTRPRMDVCKVCKLQQSGTAPLMSTLTSTWCYAHDSFSQAFPLHFCLLQVIKNWRREWPWNVAKWLLLLTWKINVKIPPVFVQMKWTVYAHAVATAMFGEPPKIGPINRVDR